MLLILSVVMGGSLHLGVISQPHRKSRHPSCVPLWRQVSAQGFTGALGASWLCLDRLVEEVVVLGAQASEVDNSEGGACSRERVIERVGPS